MFTELAIRAVRGSGRRVRRRWQAQRMLGPGRREAGDRVRIHVGGVPVLARVDPELRLPEQAAANLEVIRSRLVQAGIDFWRVPANLARPMFGVLAQDRAALLAALDHPDLAGWYRDRLTSRNRRVLRLEPPHAGLPDPVCGIVLWPYVVADQAGSFGADHQQGVSIAFWQPELAALDPGLGPDAALADFDAPADEGDERTAEEEPLDLDEERDAPAPTGWRSAVRNGALEFLGRDQVRGLRGEVPAAIDHPHLARVDFEVDVVYTWVDGADPGWQARKRAAAARAGEREWTERAADQARFTDHDELRHSLRSLEQYAPWVRHVWLVTDGQRPEWLAEHPGLTVVPHDRIWPDAEGLPTFNSHAIESCLHRIPGLAEHFLYLNDDMILGRPVRAERFFHGSGTPKFFWSNALVDYLPPAAGEIASSVAAKNARRLIARDLGLTFSRKFFHAPYPLRVSVLAELEQRYPEEFAATRHATFRSTDDVAAAGSLYFNYAYATGRSVPGQIRYDYIDPASPNGPRVLDRLLHGRNVDAFCINDGHSAQTPDEAAATDRLVRAFLAAYLPVPSRWERCDRQLSSG